MGVVYITTNKINGKKYIGVDTKNNKNYYGSGIAIRLAIKKYGTKNFIKEIIESSDDKEYLFEKEKYWISYFNAVNSNDFYNVSEGGKGGNMLTTEDSIKRHKEGNKKAIKTNIEKRKDKTYKEIYGDKADEEKQKRRLAGIGKKYSKERISKVSKSLKGNIPWNKGLSKETDYRINEQSKKINRKKSYKTYQLTTPSYDVISFDGKTELEKYIKCININLKMKSKINCDKLINLKQLKGYSLKIIS